MKFVINETLWNVNKAITIGNDHLIEKSNKQDFCSLVHNDNIIVGVVCDGCSSAKHSEVGATLIGTYLMNNLLAMRNRIDTLSIDEIRYDIGFGLTSFIRQLCFNLGLDENLQASFIEQCMTATFLFTVITDGYIYIGQCGDGIIIINGDKNEIDQDDKPEYIAYCALPGAKKTFNDFINITKFGIDGISDIAIATDGLGYLSKEKYPELYGTDKRQLQRKFNVWQNKKQEILKDDVSLIVFEKEDIIGANVDESKVQE